MLLRSLHHLLWLLRSLHHRLWLLLRSLYHRDFHAILKTSAARSKAATRTSTSASVV
jgi:hypothetical protein